MEMYSRVAAQPKRAPVPASTMVSEMALGGDGSRRLGLLRAFDAIHLSEMSHVALLRWTDTKFLLGEEQLCQALARLPDHYRILEVDGRRMQRYRTLYFDTQDLALYRQHHNGLRSRYKVRERVYADSGLVFLEVKQKTNTDTTIKSRLRTEGLSSLLARDAAPFLHAHYPYGVQELEPKLLNEFRRITLVSTRGVERVTVDVDLQFMWEGVCRSLSGMAIAEVKQEGFSMDSAFIRQMRALGVRFTSFSKYCVGVSMLYPEIKHNRFKPQLRQIAKLLYQGRIPCQTYSFH